MTLRVHVAAHPDQLVDVLCRTLAEPLPDPFAGEVVAVPTRGIERWLSQRIGSGLADLGVGDGICANVSFPSPGRVVRDALCAVPDLRPSVEAWEGAQLTAHVIAAIDDHVDEPWMALLQRYLGPDAIGTSRYAAAAKVARLFGRYARRRPEMVRAWAAGDDVGPDGVAIAEGNAWQPRLWREVRRTIALPTFSELLPDGLAPIHSGEAALDLPDRVTVYALTATDPLDLEVLAAIGGQRDVHLHVLHPSPALWEATAAHGGWPLGNRRRDEDSGTGLIAHPLLRSWSQDSRELQIVLTTYGITPVPVAPASRPATLLGRLQRDILANTNPSKHDADRSVQIHVCHGARRQVEVLRDALLHVLADDPTLEPRDIVIMTPDLGTFAPLLEAAFPVAAHGRPDHGGLPDLRLRIADRSPAATNPLVRFVGTVLDIADSRLEANLVRELVTRPTVQRRFGFDADTAQAIVQVIDDASIAWGWDAGDRLAWRAGTSDIRTWRRGLDRALTGVFFGDSSARVVADTVPLDGIEGQEARPVGILAAILDRITAIRRLLRPGMALSQWSGALNASVRVLAAPEWDEDWQWHQLDRLLAETFPEVGLVDPHVDLAGARGAVASWVEDRPSPLHFRSGDLTVCTLVPMRSVPHRVVALLGMDDDLFPRSSRRDGDDLLVDHEIVGDHDRGAEDRQLLLDAVMAAGDRLLVTYSGRDPLTNTELPPAVPIAELLDVLDDMTGDVDHVVTEHPLQAFSLANFTAGALDVDGPWSFDPVQLSGAEATTKRTPSPTTVEPTWPSPRIDDVIRLEDLIRFLQGPNSRFVRARLGFTIPEAADTADDALPADVGALALWSITKRLLDGLDDGRPLADLLERERLSDSLPPGDLGGDDLRRAAEAAAVLRSAAQARNVDPGRHRPRTGLVTVAGRSVEGSVSVDPVEHHIATVTPSRLKAKQRIRAFAELVFLTALDPHPPWTAVMIGRRDGGQGHLCVTLRSVGSTPTERARTAGELLAELVALYDEGQRTPLPLGCEAAYQWQRNVGSGRGAAWSKMAGAWEDRFGEGADPATRLVLPDVVTAGALFDAGFEEYARRLWAPVIPLCREKRI